MLQVLHCAQAFQPAASCRADCPNKYVHLQVIVKLKHMITQHGVAHNKLAPLDFRCRQARIAYQRTKDAAITIQSCA